MLGKLQKLITPNTLLNYSQACYDLANLLIELQNEGYTRLIIPSRGAYPFYEGALSALYILLGGWETHKIRTKYNLWLLPYTSDWGATDIGLSSGQVRKFWTKVLADTIRKEQTPFNKYYEELVKVAAHRLTINTSELTLNKFYKQDQDQTEKFIFIDTAVSGRAISEIIEAFVDFDLNDFLIVMIADNNGLSLDSRYKNIIEREKGKSRLVQLNVENIFSEDTSPLLNSGISSIVFPSLVEAAFNDVPEFRSGGFAGGGIWFIDSTGGLRERKPEINGIMGAMGSLIHMGIRQVIRPMKDWYEPLVIGSVEEIYQRANGKNFDIFDPKNTKKLVFDRLVDRQAATKDIAVVTESHVVRVNLEPKVISELIRVTKSV